MEIRAVSVEVAVHILMRREVAEGTLVDPEKMVLIILDSIQHILSTRDFLTMGRMGPAVIIRETVMFTSGWSKAEKYATSNCSSGLLNCCSL